MRTFRLVVFFILGSLAASLAAQTHPNEQRGFDPRRVYHYEGIDSVNTFNGNLVLTIPIGQRFQVANGLSHGLTLVYNSKPWETVGSDPAYTFPDRRSNAGTGWLLSLGRLIPARDANYGFSWVNQNLWAYESPDGNDHWFWMEPSMDYATSSNDPAMLRMRRVDDDERHIEFPNGSVHVFRRAVVDSFHSWRLEEMRDAFGNAVTIAYLQTPGNDNAEQWLIAERPIAPDSHERRIILNFVKEDHGGRRYRRLLDVRMPAFGDASGTSSAIYTFEYDTITLQRPPWDNSAGPAHTISRPPIPMPMLKTVRMPDGETWKFEYEDSNICTPCSTGWIRKLTFPSGGTIEWEYTAVYYPETSGYTLVETLDPTPFPKVKERQHQRAILHRHASDSEGVKKTWTYRYLFTKPKTCDVLTTDPNDPFSQVPVRFGSQMTTAVTDPDGITTATHYSVYTHYPFGACHTTELATWDEWDYGLPLTRYATDADGRFLSTEVVRNFPESTNGVQGRVPGTPLRSTWVNYQHIPTAGWPLPFMVKSRTVFDQDTACGGPCYTETYHRNFDGWGNFKQVTTGGNFREGGQPETPGNFRTTFTNYTAPPAVGTRPYIAGLYTEKCTREESSLNAATVNACADLTGASMQQFCFNSSNGFLERVRTVRNSVDDDTSDLLTVFTPERYEGAVTGNIAGETYYGGFLRTIENPNGAEQSVPTGCEGALPSDSAYELEHQTLFGVRARTKYKDFAFFTLDLDVDPATGLAKTARDTAGNATTFTYDLRGRILSFAAPAVAPVGYHYSPATGNARARVTATQNAGADGSKVSVYEFDGYGRLVREENTLPAGRSERRSRYDVFGRQTHASEAVNVGESPRWTTFTYDPFGRTATITTPDAKTIQAGFVGDGTRMMTRKRNLRTPQGDADSWSVELYDAQGRLWRMLEQSGPTSVAAPTGQFARTTYGYDNGGRLSRVEMRGHETDASGNRITQLRLFNYNHLGFLLSEQHPEKDGPVAYGEHDARGHAWRKTEGAQLGKFDLLLEYDRAERLTKVQQRADGLPVKELHYAANGLLDHDVRHNRLDIGNVIVRQDYAYTAGRVTGRDTEVLLQPTPASAPAVMQSFTQSFTYDLFGNVRDTVYPWCTNCGARPAAAVASLTHHYSNGWLTGVGNFGTISYHANGLVATVQHTLASGSQTDTYGEDAHGMARVGSIDFGGFCVGPPVASSEPANAQQPYHGRAVLRVADTGTRYEWFQGESGDTSHPVGTDSEVFEVPELQQTTRYWVRVHNANCFTDSRTATVTVQCPGLDIVTQPQDHDLNAGQTATFSVVATGTSLHYQWYEGAQGDTSNEVGDDAASFTTPALERPTQYWVAVTSGDQPGCLVASVTAEARVCPRVGIIEQPVDQVVKNSDPDPFARIVLSGKAPFAIVVQKQENGAWVNVLSVEHPSPLFELRPSNVTGITRYRIIASSCSTSVTSREFVLGKCPGPPRILSFGPSPAIIPYAGAGVELRVAVEGDPLGLSSDYTYAWFRTDGTLLGPTTPYITVTANTDGGAGFYARVTNTNCGGSAVTGNMYVHVYGTCPLPPPRISPAEATIAPGTSTTLYAGLDWYNVTFQWYRGEKGNTRVPLTSGAQLTVSEAGFYWFRATADCGASVDSDTVVVKNGSCSPVIIRATTPAGDIDVDSGAIVELSADAAPGVGTYRWYRGRDESNPVQPPAQRIRETVRETTTYWVSATNGCNTAASRYLTVHVVSCGTINLIVQPQDASTTVVRNGANPEVAPPVTLSATVNDPNASFAWYEGATGTLADVPLSYGTKTCDATSCTSTFTTPSLSATTKYWVRVTTGGGCKFDSRTATVNVCLPPKIHASAVNAISMEKGNGQWIGFQSVSGTDVTYQWYRGSAPDTSSPVAGEKRDQMWARPLETATFWLQATNGCGTANSPTFTVSICPRITEQPAATALVMPGMRVPLRVVAEGGSLVYRWYQGEGTANFIGEGAEILSPPVTAPATFWCLITSGTCSRVSGATAVTLCDATAVEWNPAIVTKVRRAQQQTLSVTAQPAGTYTYAWYNGPAGNVAGSTLASPLDSHFITVAPAATTTYWVRAKNSANACYGDTTALTIDVCIPQITTQPASTMIESGATTRLTVVADLANVTYQWYANGALITGATNAFLDVSPTAQTSYTVRVTGSCGIHVDSEPAVVSICAPPAITTPLTAFNIHRGAQASLGITATGTELSYQWFAGALGDTTHPVGTDSPSYTTSLQNTTRFWVRVTGRCGTATSAALVSVFPIIAAQPQNATVATGTPATLSIVADGAELTYQWYRSDGPTPVGTSSPTFTTPAVTAETRYYCVVRSGNASTTSAEAIVRPCDPPQIVSGPTSTFLAGCRTISISVSEQDQGLVTYQWYRGARGDTSTPVTTTQSLQTCTTTSETYWCRVTKDGCSIDSEAITVP